METTKELVSIFEHLGEEKKKALIAFAQGFQREAEAQRLALEEAERQRVALEAEVQRLALEEAERQRVALEEESQRLALEEAERQRVALEAEVQRLEAERQRVALEEESQRLALEEAERQRVTRDEEAPPKKLNLSEYVATYGEISGTQIFERVQRQEVQEKIKSKLLPHIKTKEDVLNEFFIKNNSCVDKLLEFLSFKDSKIIDAASEVLVGQHISTRVDITALEEVYMSEDEDSEYESPKERNYLKPPRYIPSDGKRVLEGDTDGPQEKKKPKLHEEERNSSEIIKLFVIACKGRFFAVYGFAQSGKTKDIIQKILAFQMLQKTSLIVLKRAVSNRNNMLNRLKNSDVELINKLKEIYPSLNMKNIFNFKCGKGLSVGQNLVNKLHSGEGGIVVTIADVENLKDIVENRDKLEDKKIFENLVFFGDEIDEIMYGGATETKTWIDKICFPEDAPHVFAYFGYSATLLPMILQEKRLNKHSIMKVMPEFHYTGEDLNRYKFIEIPEQFKLRSNCNPFACSEKFKEFLIRNLTLLDSGDEGFFYSFPLVQKTVGLTVEEEAELTFLLPEEGEIQTSEQVKKFKKLSLKKTKFEKEFKELDKIKNYLPKALDDFALSGPQRSIDLYHDDSFEVKRSGLTVPNIMGVSVSDNILTTKMVFAYAAFIKLPVIMYVRSKFSLHISKGLREKLGWGKRIKVNGNYGELKIMKFNHESSKRQIGELRVYGYEFDHEAKIVVGDLLAKLHRAGGVHMFPNILITSNSLFERCCNFMGSNFSSCFEKSLVVYQMTSLLTLIGDTMPQGSLEQHASRLMGNFKNNLELSYIMRRKDFESVKKCINLNREIMKLLDQNLLMRELTEEEKTAALDVKTVKLLEQKFDVKRPMLHDEDIKDTLTRYTRVKTAEEETPGALPLENYEVVRTEMAPTESKTKTSKFEEMTTVGRSYTMDDLVRICKECGFTQPKSIISSFSNANSSWGSFLLEKDGDKYIRVERKEKNKM
jgi:hypothetical protein